jgi:PIN domain nuclease of toxin-antitoxin system
MSALLLDTHALIWFTTDGWMQPSALEAIAAAQASGGILVSPISVWETGVALKKPRSRPDLQGQEVARWFRSALRIPGFKLAILTQTVAIEAARVLAVFGRGDPGDCFLIATARVKKVPIVTRDNHIRDLANALPDYVQVIVC